jgi:hypothetical protein
MYIFPDRRKSGHEKGKNRHFWWQRLVVTATITSTRKNKLTCSTNFANLLKIYTFSPHRRVVAGMPVQPHWLDWGSQ